MKNQFENRMNNSEADDENSGYCAWLPTLQVDFSQTLNRHRRDLKSDDRIMVQFGFAAAHDLLIA